MNLRSTILSAWILCGCLGLSWSFTSAGEDAAKAPSDPEQQERALLTRIRQVTFEGRRAGEGYFAQDGGKLVFQSEREPDNPFFQIYELDWSTGESRRVSPGSGKTTCAFFRPGTGEILFASTHHDPRSAEYQKAELDRRESGEEKRYDWDYDPEMELYVAPGPDAEPRRITEAMALAVVDLPTEPATTRILGRMRPSVTCASFLKQ